MHRRQARKAIYHRVIKLPATGSEAGETEATKEVAETWIFQAPVG